VLPDLLRVNKLSNNNFDTVLDSALTEKFEVTEDQRLAFLKYLND